MKKPIVSFVMPAYNAGLYLFDAIKSVQLQTFPFWELVIVDDGSTDNTSSIVYSFNDDRIRLIQLLTNKGIVNALNIGLNVAIGKYIARMDADDICEPERIELQVMQMEADPQLILLGTRAAVIDSKGEILKKLIEVNTGDQKLKASLFFSCPFVHPSIMLRKEALTTSGLQYDTSIKYAQDYVLYSKLWKYGSFDNLPQSLLKYRMHEGVERITSDTNNAAILKSRMLAWRNLLQELLLEADDDILRIHDKCIYYIDRITIDESKLIPSYLQFLALLSAQNKELRVFDVNFFKESLELITYKTLRIKYLSTGMFFKLWFQHSGLLGLHFWLKIPFKRVKDKFWHLRMKKDN